MPVSNEGKVWYVQAYRNPRVVEYYFSIARPNEVEAQFIFQPYVIGHWIVRDCPKTAVVGLVLAYEMGQFVNSQVEKVKKP